MFESFLVSARGGIEIRRFEEIGQSLREELGESGIYHPSLFWEHIISGSTNKEINIEIEAKEILPRPFKLTVNSIHASKKTFRKKPEVI